MTEEELKEEFQKVKTDDYTVTLEETLEGEVFVDLSKTLFDYFKEGFELGKKHGQ